MSSIDERVVEMRFNNSDFQSGVRSTLNSLNELNKGLKLEGASKGLQDVNAAAKNVQLGHIGSAVDSIKNKFSAMSVVGLTAMATIANKAVNFGVQLVKSFTIDPIKLGFSNYEEQINAVQTILANTGLKGKQGLSQVNDVLAQLNTYANQTVYNFSEMAKNIGTFTAAGVQLKPAAEAIKGIANLAAMSGSSSQQASSAMYQLSQALAANQVKLQDWNSVVNAGIGGKAFQEALFNTGEAMHRIKGVKIGETFDQWTKSGHTFRQSLKDGWINAKVLSTTLSGFTGDLDKQHLKALGYSNAQIKHIQEMGKVATEAATKIKTITQLKEALREEVGTAFGAIFKTLFGDINEAKSWLSPLHIFLENMLTNPLYAINRVLQGWAKLGGRVEFIDAMKKGFDDIKRIIDPIKAAFREIFPASTAQNLKSMTDGLAHLVDHLKIGSQTANNLRRTFAGVFAIFDIGWQVVKQVVHFLGDLIGAVGKSSGGILKFTGNLGDFFVHLDQAIKKGQGLHNFFAGLERVLKPVITTLGYTRIRILDLLNGTAAGFSIAGQVLSKVAHVFELVASKIRTAMGGMFQKFDFANVLNLINAGLFAGILLLVRKFVKRFTQSGPSPIQRFVDKLTEPFTKLTETLKTMQSTLRVAALLGIATAVGILTASVIELSHVDAAGLTKALTALTVMFAQLIGALAVFNRVGGAKGLISTSAGLILFATAIRVLASSVKALAGLDWQGLAKGLVGVAGLLAGLVLASRGMSGSAKGMIRTGAGLILLAEGIKILAGAVKELSGLSWSDLAKGLSGVAALLVSLSLFTKFDDAEKGGVLQGAGLVLLATGIKILASAVGDFGKMHWENIAKGLLSITGILATFAIFSKTVGNPTALLASGAALIMISGAMEVLAMAMTKFGSMPWENIAKGLVAMAGSLGIIVIAMAGMEETLGGAAALIIVSGALLTLSGALKVMGGMSWDELAKGLIVLAGSLTIITLAVAGMEEGLPGAAAMLVMSAALAIFVPELALLGSLSWGDIAKGLVALAGAFTIVGLAGLLLTPVIPSLFGLAGSIALLGVGVAAIGGGLMLFGIGLTAIATSGAAAASAIKLFVGSVVGLLPTIAIAMGKTMVALAKAVAVAAPALFKTAIVLVDQLLNAIDREAPKIVKTFYHVVSTMLDQLSNHVGDFTSKTIHIVTAMLNALANNMPKFMDAGVRVVVSFINGIAAHMSQIIKAGTNLIIRFIQGIGAAALEITYAAAQTLMTFLQGFDNAVKVYAPQLTAEGEQIAFDILAGVAKGILMAPLKLGKKLGTTVLKGFNWAIGRGSPAKEFIKAGQDINKGLIIGLVGGHQQIIDTWNNLVDDTRSALSKSKDDITKYTDRLGTLEKAHKKNPVAIRETKAALHEANLEYDRSSAILTELSKKQGKHYADLRSLGGQYDKLKTQIDDANQSLQDAIKTRDDFNKQITDQYSVLPDVGKDVTTALTDTASQITSTTVDQTKTVSALQDYTNQLQYQVNDTVKFASVVQQLREMGLNDAMYQQLLSKGPAALQFAEELLNGGADAVKNIDGLSDQLKTAAASLGANASTNLYQAGVDAAQGIVNGLKSQEKKVTDEMTKIANALITALKKKLKIKSPSEVFHELGNFTTQGLAEGLRKSAPFVESATTDLGQRAIDAMKKSISSISDAMNIDTNLNPVIAPVLDLSSVQKDAKQLDGLLSASPISVDATYSTAKDASAGYQANKAAAADVPATPPPPPGDITFNQYNTSPKALTPAEIYRQTKNQLSIAKGALTPSAA